MLLYRRKRGGASFQLTAHHCHLEVVSSCARDVRAETSKVKIFTCWFNFFLIIIFSFCSLGSFWSSIDMRSEIRECGRTIDPDSNWHLTTCYCYSVFKKNLKYILWTSRICLVLSSGGLPGFKRCLGWGADVVGSAAAMLLFFFGFSFCCFLWLEASCVCTASMTTASSPGFTEGRKARILLFYFFWMLSCQISRYLALDSERETFFFLKMRWGTNILWIYCCRVFLGGIFCLCSGRLQVFATNLSQF